MIEYANLLTLTVQPGASPSQRRIRVSIEAMPSVLIQCRAAQVPLVQEQLQRAYHLMRRQGGTPTPAELKALVTTGVATSDTGAEDVAP